MLGINLEPSKYLRVVIRIYIYIYKSSQVQLVCMSAYIELGRQLRVGLCILLFFYSVKQFQLLRLRRRKRLGQPALRRNLGLIYIYRNLLSELVLEIFGVVVQCLAN